MEDETEIELTIVDITQCNANRCLHREFLCQNMTKVIFYFSFYKDVSAFIKC